MKNYDASEVSLIVGAIEIDSGRAKGPFVRVEMESDDFDDDVGADGEVVRWKTHDRRATVTVTLMASSASNQALSALSNLDRLTPNGAGVVPFLLEDRNGDTVLESLECWVKKQPPVEYGAEPGTREWVLRLSNVQGLIAGS